MADIILLKNNLPPKESKRLLAEFPRYQLLEKENLDKRQAEQVDIVYGDSLTPEELSSFTQLRWIHVPSTHVEKICIKEIQQRGNILVSTASEENIFQMGEYAMALLLAFTKNLFLWNHNKEAQEEIKKIAEQMIWTASNRIFLQIGLGDIGTEIAKRVSLMGFKVWGIQDPPSFHPHCSKVFSAKEIHMQLPLADIVCLSLERNEHSFFFGRKEMELMKKESILLVFGSIFGIDLKDLAEFASAGKFRGVGIDAHLSESIWHELRSISQIFLSPEIGYYPEKPEGHISSGFLYNLRQFYFGNFADMKNIVNETVLHHLKSEIPTI